MATPVEHRRGPQQSPIGPYAALAILLALASTPAVRAGTLMSVNPAGASAGVTINITGTGFDPAAANNEVVFTPAAGAPLTARGTSIVVVNAGSGTRRLGVVVPAGLPVGRVTLRVVNTVSRESSEGAAIDLIDIRLADVTSALRGDTNLPVRITGSPNARFTAGTTRATFGAGITVHSTTVESATSLVATISVPASATLGPRTVGVITSTQSAVVDGFVIAEPPPPNRAPAITSSAITSATEGQAYAYDVDATDRDAGDQLTYSLTQAPSGMTIDSGSGAIAWTPAADHVPSVAVTVQVADGKGGSATQGFSISVTAANRPPRITSAPVTTAREALAYSYQAAAIDPNGDPLTYSLQSAPAGMTVSANGLITWTPPAHPPASVAVVLVVSDPSSATDTQSFDIAVSAAPTVNQPPHITSSPTLSGQVSQAYVYDVDAVDPDPADVLTYRLVQPPAGMTIDPASGVIAWTPAATQAGQVALEVQVSDGTNVARQAFEITIAGQTSSNRPPSAHAGGPYSGEAGAEIAFDGQLSSDPDGDALTFAWSFGDGGSQGSGQTPRHVYAQSGSFVVTLTVTDGHGGQSVRSTTVSIGAAGDRSPPIVSILGPREVLPGDQVTLTAQAVDNVGVEKVTFTVNGASPTESTTAPFVRAIAVPPVASPGTTIDVKAVAVDASGNAGSAQVALTITAKPDTEKPAVSINAPPLASPGTTVHLSASASDNSGIQSVAFTIDGTVLSTASQPPYEASYLIPLDAPIGSTLSIGAVALDFSANRSDAAASISIAVTADTQPPTVQLSSRSTIVAGGTLVLTAAASDNRGISSVDFYVDGVRIASDTDAPYAATFAVSSSTPAGRVLQLEARATDFAGLQGTDSRQAQIESAGTISKGTIAGEVYDDTTSLPVAGVLVTLAGSDASGHPYTETAISDARGRYLLRATEGAGVLVLTKAAWTRVDRAVEIRAGKSIVALDARLTPLAVPAAPIDPVLGATIAGPAGSGASLFVPPGGVTASATVALTPIDQQGLQGVLPAGWSPIAAADLTPHAGVALTAATLTLPRPAVQRPTATLVLARWDEEQAQWIAVATQSAGQAGPLTAAIATAAQYAWLIADAAPAAPPAAVANAALLGVAPMQIPADATTSVAPESKVVFYQPGVKTEVAGIVSAPSPVSSGAVVFTRLSESYRFTSNLETHPEAFVEDLVLYQSASGATTLDARFRVTPSLVFEAATLQSGVITVELFEPSAGSTLSELVDDAGGVVTAAGGERAEIPAHGLATPAAVSVHGIASEDLGLTLPSDLTFLGGLQLLASGAQFTAPVTLSIPAPPQLPANAQVLVARVAEIAGSSRLLLAAVGRVADGRIESSTALGPNPTALDGARTEGRYLFLQPSSPVGFAAGIVRAVNGDPFAGALVSVDTLAIASLSRAAGEYVAAAANGGAAMVALDVDRHDTGTATGTIATAAVAQIDIRLSAQPPRVVAITPANDAENVPLGNAVVVTFSEPLNPASVTLASVTLAGPGGAAVSATLSLSSGNSVVTLRPTDPLAADATYTVTIAASIADLAGYTLSQAVTSSFKSLDVSAPLPPAAGTISATMPGDDGRSTITATQGTAGPRDTVTIVNVTRGTSTPVLIDPNGGFSVIVAASLTDQLALRILDAAGNETFAGVPRFSRVNANGSVSVALGAEGGTVDGPGGVSASVKPGTFPDGAIVTIKPVAEADFPVTMTPQQRESFSYIGGVEIDFGGKEPTQYVNVSVPPSPGDKPTDQWIVNQVKELDGQKVMHIVDTAKLIGGKVTTSSPPCPGVTAAGVYGFLKSAGPVGLTYSTTSVTLGSILATIDIPYIAAPFFMPYIFLTNAYLPVQSCIPVLSGRVTITPNDVTLKVPRVHVGSNTAAVRVKNETRKTESYFGRDVLGFRLTALGSATDQFQVLGDVGGELKAFPFKVAPAATAGSVEITLGMDAIRLYPAEIVIRNTTTNPVVETHVPGDSLQLELKVAGGALDTYSVQVEDPTIGGCCPAPFEKIASALGPGNLVARAVPGTIDPTQAEIDAYNAAHPDDELPDKGRSKVEIINRTTNAVTLVPASAIVAGEFTFAFDGGDGDQFSVRVTYDDGSDTEIAIPMFRITVTDPDTHEVVKQIILPSPPIDKPLNLGKLTNDHVPPQITTNLTRFKSFDPADILTFTFSEPIDPATAKSQFFVADRNGLVAGDIRISEGNTVLTFVPARPLAFGETYSVSFAGITDRGGNGLALGILDVNTISPKLVATLATNPGPFEIRDIQIKREVAGTPQTFLVATTSSKLGNSLITIDVSDPQAPKLAGKAQAGFSKKQVSILHDITGLTLRGPSPCGSHSATFAGDLAVSTSWVTEFTYMTYFDVTDPAAPCMMGNKILTATPEFANDSLAKGTYLMFGAGARGVALIRHSQGVATYAAIPEAGIMVTDVGSNVPERFPSERVKEPMLAGDYYDIVARSGRLMALNRASRQLEILDPTFAKLAVLPLPDLPRRLIVSEAFPFDTNRNGSVEPGESIDAVFVGCDRSVVMVDIGNVLSPRLIGKIALPAIVMDLDVDRARRRLVTVDGQSSLYLIDLSTLGSKPFVDANFDGLDDRIVWTRKITSGLNGVRLDRELPYIYVGTDRGLEVYGMGTPNLTGTATYTFVPAVRPNAVRSNGTGNACPMATGGCLDYGDTSAKPIRGAIVELRDGGGALLQSTVTDETGFYSFDAPTGNVQVIVKAALGRPDDIHFEVVDNVTSTGTLPFGLQTAGPTKVYVQSSGVFAVAGSTTKDIVAQTTYASAAYVLRQGAPFAILDDIFQAEKVIRHADPTVQFPLLRAGWSPNNAPCSPCSLKGDAGYAAGQFDITHYNSEKSMLFILGAEDNDTDEYDQQVMLHEWSHYFADKFSRSDSTGGSHNSRRDFADPRLAFDEGFATAHAAMLTGNADYVDTSGPAQASGSLTDIEADQAATRSANAGTPTASDGGFFGEDSVRELLWDLFDPVNASENDTETGATIADSVALGYQPIYEVMVGYQKTTPAFTSIFSFLKGLTTKLAASPATAPVVANVVALAKGENIDPSNADEYEGLAVTDRLYTQVPADGTEIFNHGVGPFFPNRLQTRLMLDPNRQGNKLYNHVYFKLTVATFGLYEIKVDPDDNVYTWIRLKNRVGDSFTSTSVKGKDQTLTVMLMPGDYSFAVKATNNSGPVDAKFTVTVTPRSLE